MYDQIIEQNKLDLKKNLKNTKSLIEDDINKTSKGQIGKNGVIVESDHPIKDLVSRF